MFEENLIQFIRDYGYLGVLLLICIENIFPPIPSEIVLLFAGFFSIQSGLNQWIIIAAATAGSLLGAMILYYTGLILNEERLKMFVSGRFGKILCLKAGDIDKANLWFQKYQYKAVLICRCIPIVRSLISIPAGCTKMKLLPFAIYTVVGSAIWNTVLVWLGYFAGDKWNGKLKYLGMYQKITMVVFLLCGVILIYEVRKRAKK